MNIDDYFLAVERNRFIPEPPPERVFVGTGGNFRNLGCTFVKALIKAVDLQPHSAVLDVGSGIGRLALPLTQWLSADTEYLGIEIVTEGVSWCIENITSRYPNFRFVHADIRNVYYNPTGQGTTADFRVPGEPTRFDIAVFLSVFTHLDAPDADAWIGHVAKFLKPGGRVFSTWFIMDDDAIRACSEGKTTQGLGYNEGGLFWQTAEKNPGVVGYEPRKIQEMVDRHGLVISSQSFGDWCQRGRVDGGYQDGVIMLKP